MEQEYTGETLIPAIVQDFQSGKVLMLGYMNEAALRVTRETGKMTFFSRTKNRLWTKGESSGNFLLVKEMLLDCDKDTYLVKAEPTGPVCHTGNDTCFGEDNKFSLEKLEGVIAERKLNPSASYTSQLFQKGINAIAQKVGEEAVELVIESKDQDRNRFLDEAADLLYHYLVLLHVKNCKLGDVIGTLEARSKS
jgi:phosphoribosyl-ATP pyrophosphohydrolase/phosphoribosyl-AMP cyclohydrolase